MQKTKIKSNNSDLIYSPVTKSYSSFREETKKIFKNTDASSVFHLIYHNKKNDFLKKIKLKTFDPNSRDESEHFYLWTPLYLCVKLKNLEFAKLLLENGADINLVIHDYSECCGTALDLALLRNDSEMELVLRQFIKDEEISISTSFKAIRTKVRNKQNTKAFNFKQS